MAVEFECCECGYTIIRGDIDAPPAPPLCANCLFMPGWLKDPRLRELLGKEVLPKRRTISPD